MANMQPFEVRIERLDVAVVLEFVGELDLVVGEEAATALENAVADGVGIRLAILNGSGPAHRLLSLTGTDDLIEMVDDLSRLDPPTVRAQRVPGSPRSPPWAGQSTEPSSATTCSSGLGVEQPGRGLRAAPLSPAHVALPGSSAGLHGPAFRAILAQDWPRHGDGKGVARRDGARQAGRAKRRRLPGV
jgi:hypothetical protein